MWKRALNQANSPLKRIGFIFICISLSVWVSTAIHWNILHHTFFYKERYSWIEKTEKPTEVQKGAFWQDNLTSWVLYDKKCVDRDKAIKGNLLYIPPDKCRIKVIPYNRKVTYKWRESFSEFISNSFDSRWGRYFWFNTPASILLIIGFILYIGIADKVVAWVQTGNVKR